MSRKVVQLVPPEERGPPPADLDAEAAVLSAIILSRDALEAVALQPWHFYSDANRWVFEAVLELAQEARPVDVVSLASRLRESNRLEQIDGGTTYLARLIDATPAVAHVAEHADAVRRCAERRGLIHAHERAAVRLLAGDDVGDVQLEVERSQPARPKSGALAQWTTLSEAFLADDPPLQDWLLKRPVGMRDVGVFPKGKAGILTATGGVGKTYALIDLAIAVALGGFWLGTFRAPEAGHVLLALGEEDIAEAQRRLWRTCNARELSREERSELGKRIVLLPMHGQHVALTYQVENGPLVATPFAEELRKRMCSDGREWSLAIFDPLSRWAGGNVEGDNEAATRFVQVVESFCTVPGLPAVLMAHHSSKTSAKDGASDARGVTGIRDGFRWQAAMDEVDSGVRLTNRKSNYSARFDELFLTKSTEPGYEGTLRPTSAEAVVSPAPDFEGRVLETVTRHPGLTSARQIAELTKGTSKAIFDAVKQLRSTSRLVLTATGFVAASTNASADR